MRNVKHSEVVTFTTKGNAIMLIDGKKLTCLDDAVLTNLKCEAIARCEAVDEVGIRYNLYWEIMNPSAGDFEDCCNWDNVDFIEELDD